MNLALIKHYGRAFPVIDILGKYWSFSCWANVFYVFIVPRELKFSVTVFDTIVGKLIRTGNFRSVVEFGYELDSVYVIH